MSAALESIMGQCSQEWKVLSNSSSTSSLAEFEMVDSTPAPEDNLFAGAELCTAASQVEESIRFFESLCTTGTLVAEADPCNIEEEIKAVSEAESDFEEIVPQVDFATVGTPAELQGGEEAESCRSSPSLNCQFFELGDELDSCDGANVQFDEPEALPATTAEEESSTRTSRRRRSSAPVKVGQLVDEIRQKTSDGLSEAVRLIDALDERIDDARPHVCHGAIYCKEQVQGDLQSMAEEMQDAFGEGQEAEQRVSASLCHIKDQFKNDFANIHKDVDAALVCLLGNSVRPSEQDRGQKTLKTAVPATTCSLVSLAVASWLVPLRLARCAATNLAM